MHVQSKIYRRKFFDNVFYIANEGRHIRINNNLFSFTLVLFIAIFEYKENVYFSLHRLHYQS